MPRPLTRLGHLGMLRLDHGGVALSGAQVSFEHFDHLRSVWKHLGEQSVPRAGRSIAIGVTEGDAVGRDPAVALGARRRSFSCRWSSGGQGASITVRMSCGVQASILGRIR